MGRRAARVGLTWELAALMTLLPAVGAWGESRADGFDVQLTFERIEVLVGAPSTAMVATDVDRDGHLDLLVTAGDEVAVLTNAGAGRFEISSRIAAGPHAVDIAAADLDEDAWADLVVANHETTHVTVLFGAEDGFAPRGSPRMQVDVAPHPHAVRLADLDGDSHVDLLVDDRDREAIRVFRGRGDGTFAEPSLVDVGGDPYRGFVLADLDGDGRLDLVTPNPNHVAVTTGSDPEGSVEPLRLQPGFAPFSVATGDYNGDGLVDLAAGSGEEEGSVAVWLGRPDGSFAAPIRYEIADGPTKTSSADLNGDGRDELLVASYVGGELAVLVGGDEPTLQRFRLPGNPYGFATGDFNRDGRVDFAVANDSSDDITVFLTARSEALQRL